MRSRRSPGLPFSVGGQVVFFRFSVQLSNDDQSTIYLN